MDWPRLCSMDTKAVVDSRSSVRCLGTESYGARFAMDMSASVTGTDPSLEGSTPPRGRKVSAFLITNGWKGPGCVLWSDPPREV